ncbi:hypothetical protein [Brachyspira sp.]|uniref:hypothetical protein n=1 Tax=Brachyspira sp. TaxID=1977261 RepID=UPI003D7C7AF3
MTNKKTIKFLAILTAVVMLFAIACKNKQTAPISASEVISGEMPIDLTQDVSQFAGKTFRSDVLDTGISYLWVRISEDSTIKYQAAGVNEPDFSIANELVISKGMGQNYVFQGKAFASGEQSGRLVFEPDGTLTVKFISGNSYVGQTIECKWVDLLK